jgi:serine/threonine protein kinase
MSLTLHIKGGPATEGAQSGLDRLKDSGADDAKRILEQLRDKFAGRTGVVRLMHTTKANRRMKFSDAGGFKQKFIRGSKLESTGRVIAQLMERSREFSQKEIDAFKQYASTRGRAGIESEHLATYLTPLDQATYTSTEKALQALGVNSDQALTLGTGGQGSVTQVMMNDQPYALKTFVKGQIPKVEVVPEQDPSGPVEPPLISSQPEASDSAKTEIKLARTRGIGVVARMKDLDQIVQPSVYLISEWAERRGNLPYSRVHIVKGGRALKDWAKTQPTHGSEFTVKQYLMPLAAGKQLMTYNKDTNKFETGFSQEELPSVARSMVRLLEQMWRHGFVNGDIKPENLFWDASSKTLRAIDIDSFQKVSKKDGSALPEGGLTTWPYTHPAVLQEKKATLGRDLFSAGMVLLEAALRSRGEASEARRILLTGVADFNFLAMRRNQNLPDILDKMKARLNFADGGVEDFAILCIKTSLDYEEQRSAQGVNHFERYGDNAGANHPMSILKGHPLMSQDE